MIRLALPCDYAATLKRALEHHCKHVAETRAKSWPEFSPGYDLEIDRARRVYFILSGALLDAAPDQSEYFGA